MRAKPTKKLCTGIGKACVADNTGKADCPECGRRVYIAYNADTAHIGKHPRKA